MSLIQLHCNRITESLLTGRIFLDLCGLYKPRICIALVSGGSRDISRSWFFGLCNRYCWLSLAKGVRSRTQGMFSGLTDGATITYICLFNIYGTSSENRDLGNCCLTYSEGSWCCHINVNGAVQDGVWFAGGDWAGRAYDRGDCCCSGAQLQYGPVINVSLLFSRCVKLPLAEEYSPPCPDRGTCNGSNGLVEGKALSKSAGSFSAL